MKINMNFINIERFCINFNSKMGELIKKTIYSMQCRKLKFLRNEFNSISAYGDNNMIISHIHVTYYVENPDETILVSPLNIKYKVDAIVRERTNRFHIYIRKTDNREGVIRDVVLIKSGKVIATNPVARIPQTNSEYYTHYVINVDDSLNENDQIELSYTISNYYTYSWTKTENFMICPNYLGRINDFCNVDLDFDFRGNEHNAVNNRQVFIGPMTEPKKWEIQNINSNLHVKENQIVFVKIHNHNG